MDRTSSSTHFGHGEGNSGVPRDQRGGNFHLPLHLHLSSSCSSKGLGTGGTLCLAEVRRAAWVQDNFAKDWQRAGGMWRDFGRELSSSSLQQAAATPPKGLACRDTHFPCSSSTR